MLPLGRIRAAPLPSLADRAEDVCRGRALIVWRQGLVPHFAQRRVILFFWPTRASSANQTRPGRKLSIAHGPEFAAQYLLADADAIFFETPLREIDKSPALRHGSQESDPPRPAPPAPVFARL
jgi:hypothetical protein